MSPAPVRSTSLAAHRGALPPDFACTSTSDGACVHVHLAGELDIAAIAPLQPMLQDAQSRAPLVLLDLRDVTFMDSAGVHTIVNASAAARERGHSLVLLRGSPHIDRVFRDLVAEALELAIAGVGRTELETVGEAGARLINEPS